jgi:hypothetical protein
MRHRCGERTHMYTSFWAASNCAAAAVVETRGFEFACKEDLQNRVSECRECLDRFTS